MSHQDNEKNKRLRETIESLPPMTSDTAERARECLVFNDPCHNDVNIPTTVKNISALLTQVQAEARLEEAKWWFDQYCPTEDPRAYERIAALAQALQPATGDK